MTISIIIHGKCKECGTKKEFEVLSDGIIPTYLDRFDGKINIEAKGIGEGYCTTCEKFRKFNVDNLEIKFGGGA